MLGNAGLIKYLSDVCRLHLFYYLKYNNRDPKFIFIKYTELYSTMKNSLENVCRACLSSELKEMHSFAEFSEFDDNLGSILHKCCDIEVLLTEIINKYIN